MKCAVVILNWNTEDYLRKFLPGVLDSTAGIADVVEPTMPPPTAP